MLTNDIKETSSFFNRKGYCLLKNDLSAVQIDQIESEYQQLFRSASDIISEINHTDISYADYYQKHREAIIAVPEMDDEDKLCRFEFITGGSEYFANEIVPFLAKRISSIIGHEVTLFKDKCNLKSPGGGAFPCHQDIPAYIDFGPNIHITAAIMLDPSYAENGALEMADNFMNIVDEGSKNVDTPLGQFSIFDFYKGGSNNGKIIDSIEHQFAWTPVYTQSGDVLLFNSYIPHRSATNNSNMMRRAFFLTFNLARQGEHYQQYYKNKRDDFGNPKFHIATPTAHDDSDGIE